MAEPTQDEKMAAETLRTMGAIVALDRVRGQLQELLAEELRQAPDAYGLGTRAGLRAALSAVNRAIGVEAVGADLRRGHHGS